MKNGKKGIVRKLFMLSFMLLMVIILLVACTGDTEEKDTSKESVKVSFEYNGEMYSTNLSMPIGEHSYELTVLEEYTDDIISAIEQFKQVENKEEYENLTIFFFCAEGEVIDKDGNVNEEPVSYGWIRLSKDEVENINIDYYKENPLMLFDNYDYNTVGLKK